MTFKERCSPSAAERQPASRQLPRRDRSSSSCRTLRLHLCVVDLHAITVWQDPKVAHQATATSPRPSSPAASTRRSTSFNQPGRRAPSLPGCSTASPARLAQPHDPVQGEGGQGPRERLGRALRLSEPDGRHPGLPPTCRSARTEAAPELRATSRRSLNNDYAERSASAALATRSSTEPLIQGPRRA